MSIKLNSALGGSVTLNEPSTAIAYNLTLPTDNIQPGMNLITPTSVVGGTFNGGAISFSAASSISVNGVFSSLYDNYKLIFRTLPSTNNELDMRLRLSGTDAVTNYIWQYVYAGATTIATAGSTATYAQIAYIGSFNYNISEMILSGPALASNTSYICLNAYMNSASTVRQENWYGVHTTATAYDGATFYNNTGNMTGTLRIYGMRNQ